MESPTHISPDTATNPVDVWPPGKLPLRDSYKSKNSVLAHTRSSRILGRAEPLHHKPVHRRDIPQSQHFLLQRVIHHAMPDFPLGRGIQESTSILLHITPAWLNQRDRPA